MTVRRLVGAVAASALLTGSALLSTGGLALASTTAGTVMLSASGTGAEEVPPGSGEEGARVTGSFQLTPAGAMTYTVRITGNSEPVTAGHIHRGAAGVNGDVVVPLDTAAIVSGSSATAQVDPALAAEIIANPSGFYLNTHSPSFAPPAGNARGQLTTASSGAPGSIDTGTGGQAAEGGPTSALVGGGAAVLLAAGAVTVARRRRAVDAG
jgi:hypothetical protein